MKNIMRNYAMMIPFIQALEPSKLQRFERKSKARIEVEEVLNVLKCTPEELKEKCLKNKKLLSESGNLFLNYLIETRKEKL